MTDSKAIQNKNGTDVPPKKPNLPDCYLFSNYISPALISFRLCAGGNYTTHLSSSFSFSFSCLLQCSNVSNRSRN